MKIAICSDAFYLQSNTIANHVNLLIKGLNDLGHEIKVFTTDIEIKKANLSVDVAAFTGNITNSIYKQGLSFTSFNKVKKALSDFAPELIHIFSFNTLGIACAQYAKKTNTPIISTIFQFSDCFSHKSKSFLSFIKMNIYRKAAEYILSKSQKVGSLAPYAQLYIKKLGVQNSIARVPHCVDTDLFCLDAVDTVKLQNFRQKYNLTSEYTYVLYAGNINDTEQLGNIFDTWTSTVRPSDHMKLVLAGECFDEHEITEIAKLHGANKQFIYLGELLHEEMNICYLACDVFLCTNNPLDIHFSPIEAIACGLPVLAPKNSANRYLIQNGVNGFIYQDFSELKNLFQNFSALDETGKHMLRNLVSGTMRGMDEYTLAHTMEAIYYSMLRKRP